MGQKLILPINNALLTASAQTAAYRTRFGFEHYGIDMVSAAGDTLVYSCGTGTVLACGYDSLFGNTIVLRYDDCINTTGKTANIICRLYHMASLQVTAGQQVTKNTPLGNYGNTGKYSAGAHLHIELDRDIEYPFYSPTLTGQSTFFRGTAHGATAATIENPLLWLHRKASPPDDQTYTTADDAYIRTDDKNIALYDEPAPPTPQKTPEEITVDAAVADGLITGGERTYWVGVLAGTVKPSAEKIKSMMDTAHKLLSK